MCRKLIYLAFFVLVLALADTNVVFGGIVWEGRVNRENDDVEESVSGGSMYMNSGDLEMPYQDPGKRNKQKIGIRFTNVGVPPGAFVANAYVEFTCDETKDGTLPVSLLIEGDLSPDAAAFSSSARSVTKRPKTTAKAVWVPANWTATGQTDQTSNIASVIQEIVSQGGWASGNSLVLIIRDDPSNPSQGLRCAEAGPGNDAALLHIEFASKRAAQPSPANGALHPDTWVSLSWMPGDFAASHDVYFGDNFADVDAGTGGTFLGNQTETSFIIGLAGSPYPEGLAQGTTYYWRIDEVSAGRVTTIHKGDVWSFTTVVPSIKKGPYLIYPGDNTQMTVLWQLDGPEPHTLRWGQDTSYSDGSATTAVFGDFQYEHTIAGLTPGTKYYYEVEGVGSGSFLAAPPDGAADVKFLAYGDTRSKPQTHDAVNAQMIVTYTTDPAYQTFTMLAGDWVTDGDFESDWTDQFFNRSWQNTMEMQANLPINGCIGNHEKSGTVFEKYWPYPYESGGRYWSFDYGPAHIVVLDQFTTSYAPGSPQYMWLQNDLANATAPWKFVQLHAPGWSASSQGNNSAVQNYIQPLCETYGVAIVFAGHKHYYARAMANGVAHITTGGGGAPLYQPEDGHPNIVVHDKSNHFCKIDIQGGWLAFEAVRLNGTVIDTFTMSHFVGPITSGMEDFETGDFSRLLWEHSGDENWVVTSRQKHSGAYSAKAGGIEDDGNTTLHVTLDCGDGDVTFYCKVSSESGSDYLKFYIDGVKQGEWSGEQDWIQVSFPVTAGIRTFEWTYSKDGSESVGDDTAWIDDIVFPVN